MRTNKPSRRCAYLFVNYVRLVTSGVRDLLSAIRAFSLLLVALLAFTALPATATARLSDEAQLIQLEHDYARALINKDRTFLMRFYAPDWRGGNWMGFWTKSRMINSLLDKRYVVKSMRLYDLRVRVMGNTAVVQGTDDEVTSMGGRDTSGKWTFTDVFERRGGRWVAVASQTTQVQPEPR